MEGESRTSRSTATIVRANAITPFNAILLALGLLTLVFGDWRDALFLAIILTNTGIGIWQELHARRKLDDLAALVAPQATVVRDGTSRSVHVSEVVVDDLVLLAAGDQVVADGKLLTSSDLRLDESILTGEAKAVARSRGDEVRSGSFVVEGTGSFLVGAVGAESYAERIAGTAREFRHPRSPLERAIDRLLYVLLGVTVPLGAMLIVALWKQDVAVSHAVETAVAGMVTLIPEGLVLLVSITYAAAAVRMARVGALSQQLNAIESLASVDTLCIDKTGTLTEPGLRVVSLVPAVGATEEELGAALGRFAASSERRNSTLEAIAAAWPADPEHADDVVPFLSRRRWSGMRIGGVRYVLGAPELFALAELAEPARDLQRAGRRVVGFGITSAAFPDDRDVLPPARPLGLVVLAEELRPGTRETIAFLAEQGVEIVVLSGDSPSTVASLAGDAGIPERGHYLAGDDLPEDDVELDRSVGELGVVGRISPEGKRRVVEALRRRGRYVAMVGDGVNDVPALKASRLSIAQGSGTQMAKAVSDVVLVNGDFAAVPGMVAEGRRVLRNIQRVTKLFVTKSVFAAFLIVAIGITPGRVSTPAATPDHRRHPDRRDPRFLPRACAKRRALAHRRLPPGGGPILGPRRRCRGARRDHDLPDRAQRLRPRAAPVAHRCDDRAHHHRPLPRSRARGDQHATRQTRRNDVRPPLRLVSPDPVPAGAAAFLRARHPQSSRCDPHRGRRGNCDRLPLADR